MATPPSSPKPGLDGATVGSREGAIPEASTEVDDLDTWGTFRVPKKKGEKGKKGKKAALEGNKEVVEHPEILAVGASDDDAWDEWGSAKRKKKDKEVGQVKEIARPPAAGPPIDLVEDDSGFFDDLDVGFFHSATHPCDLDFEHSSWQGFADDLSEACRSVFPQKSAQYLAVHALLLNWEEDDLGTQDELVDLQAVFKDQFHFTTEIWRIPTTQSEDKLEQKISQVKAECGGENKLLIVYYGGHGKFDASGRSIWHAWRRQRGKPKSPMLNWSLLQPMLKRAPCDVFIILDCCFAASAARGDVNGVNELLAACGREVEAIGVSDRSFTRNLIRKLRSFGTQPFTVNQLYERLLKDRKRLMNTPGYFPLSGHNMPSICLAPLPDAEATSADSEVVPSLNIHRTSTLSSSTASSSADISRQATTTTPASTPPRISIAPDGSRVLLAISLKDDAMIPDLSQWTQWLTSEAPYDIQNIEVKIESAYLSHSTLVLVSMPASVWSHLPDNAAYRFIGFVTSQNLVPEGIPQSLQVGDTLESSREKTKASVQRRDKPPRKEVKDPTFPAKSPRPISHDPNLTEWLEASSGSDSFHASDDEFYDSDTNITIYSSRAPSMYSAKPHSARSYPASILSESDSVSRQSSDSRGRLVVEPLERPRRRPVYRDFDYISNESDRRPRSSISYQGTGNRRPVRTSTYQGTGDRPRLSTEYPGIDTRRPLRTAAYPGTGPRRPNSFHTGERHSEPLRLPPPRPAYPSQFSSLSSIPAYSPYSPNSTYDYSGRYAMPPPPADRYHSLHDRDRDRYSDRDLDLGNRGWETRLLETRLRRAEEENERSKAEVKQLQREARRAQAQATIGDERSKAGEKKLRDAARRAKTQATTGDERSKAEETKLRDAAKTQATIGDERSKARVKKLEIAAGQAETQATVEDEHDPPSLPAVRPKIHTPPSNTSPLSALPINTSHEELNELISKQRGFKRLWFELIQDKPTCFADFEDEFSAANAVAGLLFILGWTAGTIQRTGSQIVLDVSD